MNKSLSSGIRKLAFVVTTGLAQPFLNDDGVRRWFPLPGRDSAPFKRGKHVAQYKRELNRGKK